MKKFDYYIIRYFLSTFAMSITLILAIAVVFDFSEKIDNFIDTQAPVNLIIKDYYINFIIHYGVLFSGLITFISVIFFTSKLSDNNEIIALYNNHISPLRILVPYMISAGIIFLINIYCQNWFLPDKNEKRLNFENTYIKNKDILRHKKLHKQIDENTFIFIKSYDVKNTKGYNCNIQKFSKNNLYSKVSAHSIYWDNNKETWKLIKYKEDIYEDLTKISSFSGKEKEIKLNILPEEMFYQERSIKSMNYSELTQFIYNEEKRGSHLMPLYNIEKHERFSYPFSILIFTLLGFLISNQNIRGGMGYKLAIGIAICFFYIFIMKFSITLTINSNIPAFISVWTPNIVCMLITIVSFKRLT